MTDSVGDLNAEKTQSSLSFKILQAIYIFKYL